MKKIAFRTVETIVNYVTVTDKMEAIQQVIKCPGKLNLKKAIALLEENEIRYLTNSVGINVIDRKFRIPLDVILKLVNASLNGEFIPRATEVVCDAEDATMSKVGEDGEQIFTKFESEKFVKLVFPKDMVFKSNLTPIRLKEVELVEGEYDDMIDDVVILDGVKIPESAMNYLLSEFEVNTEKN